MCINDGYSQRKAEYLRKNHRHNITHLDTDEDHGDVVMGRHLTTKNIEDNVQISCERCCRISNVSSKEQLSALSLKNIEKQNILRACVRALNMVIYILEYAGVLPIKHTCVTPK